MARRDGKEPERPMSMFADRMKRERKEAEWRAAVQSHLVEMGGNLNKATYAAMLDMGYAGPEDERRRYQEYKETLAPAPAFVPMVVHVAEVQPKRNESDPEFEELLSSLPDKASPAVETGYIRSHPAMARRARGGLKVADIVLTCDDIRDAPSKSAVIALQHYANCPQKFFDSILSEDKKKSEVGAEQAGEVDAGIEEIRRLLGTIKSRRQSG
jgi:hypothetical protein